MASPSQRRPSSASVAAILEEDGVRLPEVAVLGKTVKQAETTAASAWEIFQTGCQILLLTGS